MASVFWNVDADGDWSNSADWSPEPPVSGDDVTIDTADFHTITYSIASATTVNSLTVGNDDFVMTSDPSIRAQGSLTITNGATFANGLTLNNGKLELDSNATVSGLLLVDEFKTSYPNDNQGLLAGTGTLTAAGGADFTHFGSNNFDWMIGTGITLLQGSSTIEANTTLYLDSGRTLENQGTLTLATGSFIFLGAAPYASFHGSGGTLTNDASGTIVFEGSNLGSGVEGVNGVTAFNNAGTLEINGYTGIDCSFVNTGTVSVNSGTLDLTRGGSSAASAFTVAAGATLDFSSVDDGPDATFTFNGTLAIDGSLQVGEAATFNIDAFHVGQNFTCYGTVNMAGVGEIGGSLATSSPAVMNTGSLTVAGDVEDQGTLNTSGPLSIGGI